MLVLFPQARSGQLEERMRIAFVGSCLPRQCSMSTFSYNLNHALKHYAGFDGAYFIAVNNDEGHDYPSRVIFEIEQDNWEDYFHAADLVNSFGVDAVSLQHDFDLFGGPDGIYVTDFLRHLKKPVVTTCHTVLENPSCGQKKVFMKIAYLSQSLVAMNRGDISSMADIYDIPRSKICLIPQGVSEREYKEPFSHGAAELHLVENSRKTQSLHEKSYALGRQRDWSIAARQYMEVFVDAVDSTEKERIRQRRRVHTLHVPV